MPYTAAYIQTLKRSSKSDAKGIEKIIFTSATTIQSISYRISTLFYGKEELSTENQKDKRLKNPLDMGILPLLDILTSVDACELVNYSLDKLRTVKTGGRPFNPKSDPPADAFGKIKWSFQKTAFDVQTQIDGFYNDVEDPSNLNTSDGAKLLNLITRIKNSFASFTQVFSSEDDPQRLGPIDPDIITLLDAFPQLRNVGNYINDSLSSFDRFADFRQLQNADIQRAINSISKIRQYCVLIQSLNNPVASAVVLGQSAITSQLDKLLKDVDVQKLIPTLKKISKLLKQLVSIMNNVKGVIDIARLMIRVFLTLIFVFRVIIQFLKLNPIPNLVTAIGITTVAADTVKKLEENGPKTFEVRLAQINTLLDTVSLFLNTTLPLINEVIQKINSFIASIERCKDVESILPTDILNEIKSNISDAQNAANDLQAFLDTKKQNDLTRSSNTQIGQFTINIITEQVIDESISLRRRYGVALNNQGILQVQSQPTFASDDNVIINEVKLLLQQKGLIKQDTSIYSESEINTMNESRAYLADDNLDIYPNPANENVGLVDNIESGQDAELLSEMKDLLGESKRGKKIIELATRRLNKNRQNMNQQLTERRNR